MYDKEELLNYIAGLVVGDGSLYSYKHEYYIYIYDRDGEYLEWLKNEIEDVLKVRAHLIQKKNYYRLQISSKQLYEELYERIDRQLKDPTKSFIAGFTDAEGTLYIDKKCRLTLEISNTDHEMMYSIWKAIIKKQIRATITEHRGKRGRKTLYKIRIRGWLNVERFIELFKPVHPKLVDKFKFLRARCLNMQYS